MEKKKQIGEHIVDHLSERMNEEIVDPVLDEWLAEDESNQEDFKRYKEIFLLRYQKLLISISKETIGRL